MFRPMSLLRSTCVAGLLLSGCAARTAPDRRVLDAPPPVSNRAPVVLASGIATEASPWAQRRRVFEGRGVLRAPTVRWRTMLGGPVKLPLTVGDTGVWAVASGVVSLVLDDGAVELSASLNAATAVSVAPDGPVVGATDGTLLAFSPTTGAITLAWKGSGRARGAAVPLAGGMAWASSDGSVRHTSRDLLATLHAVTSDPSSDESRAYFQTQAGQLVSLGTDGPAWSVQIGGPGIGPPVVGEGVILAAWDSFQGALGGVLSVDSETGSRTWEARLAAPPSAGMALAPGLLLVPLADGTLQAMDPATGLELWAARLGPDTLTTAPLVAGSSAWVGDAGGRLYRVDLDDGGVAWSLDLGAAVTSGPEPAWDVLVVGLSSGELVAIGEDS